MLASGLESSDDGQITFNGEHTLEVTTKKLIGVSSDKIHLPEFLTAKQILTFHTNQFGCDIDEEILEGLSFKPQLGQKTADLSLGNQKKLSLLMAILHKPKLLLLDEPTVGLDEASKVWLLKFLDKFDGTIIVTSHESVFLDNDNYEQLSMSELNTPWKRS